MKKLILCLVICVLLLASLGCTNSSKTDAPAIENPTTDGSIIGTPSTGTLNEEEFDTYLFDDSSDETPVAYDAPSPDAPPANPDYADAPVNQRESLSDTCDYILCKGTDNTGNTYALVANQKETALGYEITVGIIKNNEWFYPLSSDFPFLSGGLFPMEGGLALTRVSSAKLVATYIYFIDSGAFAMEYATLSPMRKVLVIYNCNTLQCYTYYGDDYTWLYLYSDVDFENNSVESFDVQYYGRIATDNGQILIYKDVSDPYAWSTPKTYDWFVLDTKTMEMRTIASSINLHPECVLAEGLIFASDHCFYNLQMEKVIDLSLYDIDNESLYFKNGKCTFIAENDLGTEFEITIDAWGQILSEVKQ